MSELDPTLTVKEVALYLKQGLTKTKADIKTGKLKSYKNGRLRRVKREWLLEYEQSLTGETLTEATCS